MLHNYRTNGHIALVRRGPHENLRKFLSTYFFYGICTSMNEWNMNFKEVQNIYITIQMKYFYVITLRDCGSTRSIYKSNQWLVRMLDSGKHEVHV